jgi:hypothetical protein
VNTAAIVDPRFQPQLPPDLRFGFARPAVEQIRPDYSLQLLLLGVGLGVLLMMLMNRGGDEQ